MAGSEDHALPAPAGRGETIAGRRAGVEDPFRFDPERALGRALLRREAGRVGHQGEHLLGEIHRESREPELKPGVALAHPLDVTEDVVERVTDDARHASLDGGRQKLIAGEMSGHPAVVGFWQAGRVRSGNVHASSVGAPPRSKRWS
jgi:hypothetical protein